MRLGVGKFIFSSSAAVYGTPINGVGSESSSLRPINPYGWSKLMTERMAGDIGAACGMAVSVLRYFNVAGADPEGRTGQSTRNATHLIKVACEVALGKRDRLVIFGTDYDTPDGTCIRDYVHVYDLAQAHVVVLGHMGRDSENYLCLNCGNGRGYSVREVVAAVEKITGRKLPTREAGRRYGDPPVLLADPQRIVSEIGWRARYPDIIDIVSSALSWEERLG